jgi:hypothetical protein
VLKRWKEKREREAKITMANINVEREAARKLAREAKVAGLPNVPRIVMPPVKRPRNAGDMLRPWKKVLSPSYDAMRGEVREQQQRLRSMRKHAGRLFGISGDPTLLDFLDTADSITVAPSPVVDPEGNSFISVIPPSPVTSIAPFNNLVRFTSASISAFGDSAEFAWLNMTMTYMFSFIAPNSGVCTVIPAFLPNAVFNVTTPQAAYIFPWSHAVPHGSLAFTATVEADTFLPGITSPPIETVTGMVASPGVSLSGWTGFHSVSGGLSLGTFALPASVTLSPFLVINGARVVISVQYFLQNFLTEGGTATVDAASRTNFGFNVPFVLVRVDY